jgi:Gas vesicle synthesis protein GvpL/GvpF
VYAIVPSGPWAPGSGIDGLPLRMVDSSGVAAVVHDHGDRPPLSGSGADVERRVLEHGAVVERCWEQAGTVLPMTVNVLIESARGRSADQLLAGWLSDQAAMLAARLDSLRGMVELRIDVSLESQVVGDRDAEVQAIRSERLTRPTGVQRLLQKRIESMERELADRLADDLHPQLRRRIAALSEAVTENRGARRQAGQVSVLSVASLVKREDIERLGSELSLIQVEEPAARITFSGPWPPYSFADAPAPEETAGG